MDYVHSLTASSFPLKIRTALTGSLEIQTGNQTETQSIYDFGESLKEGGETCQTQWLAGQTKGVLH